MIESRNRNYEVNMMNFTVLIADDEPMPRRVLQAYPSNNGGIVFDRMYRL